jgi:hypothetical protein
MPKKAKKEPKMLSVKKRKIMVGPDAQAEVSEVEADYKPTDLHTEPLPVEGSSVDNPLTLGDSDRKECGPDSESEDEMHDGQDEPVAGSSAENALELDDSDAPEVVEIDD